MNAVVVERKLKKDKESWSKNFLKYNGLLWIHIELKSASVGKLKNCLVFKFSKQMNVEIMEQESYKNLKEDIELQKR